MKLLLVTWVDPWVRCVSTVHKWVEAGRALGHEVAVFGDPQPELPSLPYTTDLSGVDLALFIVQVPSDLPDMPYLARLLDGIPREKRVVVDLWGRFNDTIRLEHDFNHLEKLDGHLGWEWEDAIRAVAGTIAQPTLAPLRPSVRSFLFHGYDPGSVVRPYNSAREAAAAWSAAGAGREAVRGDVCREQLAAVGSGSAIPRTIPAGAWQGRAGVPGRLGLGPAAGLGGAKGIMGIDTDAALLAELDVDVRHGVRFDEVVGLLGKARFAPVFHRPLFRHLGFVTNRTFETFYADALPVLMLPRDFVTAVYGPAALALVPLGDVGAHLTDALDRPEPYWDAVLQTRSHLARHHSYVRRFEELGGLVERSGAAR